MARRSRKKTKTANSPQPMLIGAGVAIFLLISFFSLSDSKPSNTTGSAKTLPLDVYYSNPSSIRGSKFSVSGEVISKLRYDKDVGQAIQISVTDGDSTKLIAVFIPKDTTGPNIDPKQNYIFTVEVTSDRWLQALSYNDI